VTSWAVILILVTIAILARRSLRMVPGRFQALLEMGYEFMFNFIADTLESKELARKFFPFLVTLFLFIFAANLLEFLPGVGSIGFFGPEGFIPLFRSVNTDLNVTLALTIISVLTIEIMGVVTLGILRYGGKFINFSSPLNFVVGLIELVSELARLVSFSFRLFGNIFAGEVLIAVVAFFVPYILPVPLMAFEMFVGLVQAAIFTLLTLFFIKLAITAPEHH
jgi:F-type H+-transporting ATPase subunit a